MLTIIDTFSKNPLATHVPFFLLQIPDLREPSLGTHVTLPFTHPGEPQVHL